MFFVGGTQARVPTTKKRLGYTVCIRLQPLRWRRASCYNSVIRSLAVTNFSRRFCSLRRASIGLSRPSRINSKSGCCSRPRGAVNARNKSFLLEATSVEKVVINKMPLTAGLTD